MTEPTGRHRISPAFATICGWHLALAVGYVGWVLTWPGDVGTGGELNLSTTRSAMAILLGLLLVAPGLAVSFGISCGVLTALRRRGRWGATAGTLASLAGLATVAGLLALYVQTR